MASTTVTVTVYVAVPLATTSVVGEAVAVDSVALSVVGSNTKPTVGCCVTTTCPAPGLIVAVIVFVSAFVLAIVPVVTPLALVAPGWIGGLLVRVGANCTL